jgi:hypothetical protein
MNTQQLIIDSRDRENTATEDRSTIRINFAEPRTFQRVSLVYCDFPIDAAEDDEESIYYITIKELPRPVIGANQTDEATFLQIRTTDTGFRSLAFESSSFPQTIDLGSRQSFRSFTIQVRYRYAATDQLILNSDYVLILRLE